MRSTNDIKNRNLLDIIKAIWNNGAASKPQIADRLGVTGVTVHNFINELTSCGLVKETGIADSNGGRKAILYSLNPGFAYIIGQDFSAGSINTYIFDFNLKLVHKRNFNCSMEYSQRILDTMADEIIAALEYSGIKPDSCLGIGISVPGQVDYREGVVKNIPHIKGWQNIPVKSNLERKTGIAAYVDNDTNNLALVSKWTGQVPRDSDSVALSVSRGVGAGFLIKGEVFRGAHSNAGEIGHTTVLVDGPRCSCGNKGCLDVLLSDDMVLGKVKALPENAGIEIDMNKVIEMAKGKNTGVSRILSETANYAAIAVSHISKTYDPGYIVVYSDWMSEIEDISYSITDSVFTGIPWITREDLQIRFSSKSKYECYCGAVSVLEDALSYRSGGNLLLKRLRT